MQFTYQARSTDGELHHGVIAADHRDEVAQQLRQKGLFVVTVETTDHEVSPTRQVTLFAKPVSKNDMIYFTNQLAIMVDSGVPLSEALASLSEQAEHPTLQKILKEIYARVESGESLSAALADYPKQFNTTYVNLVKASEASGTLGSMLERIASQLRAELELRQKVLGAMLYPLVMLVMCAGICIFLLTFVFPRLTPMFETRQIDLPQPTVIMMTLSNILRNDSHFVILGCILIAGGYFYSQKQVWGRQARDWFVLNIPIIGAMLRKVAISRSLRTLAITINAGVPVLEAIRLSAAVSNNSLFEKCWNNVYNEVTHGRQIHEALVACPLIPATLRQMIASGEMTGQLGPVLSKISDYYDREVAIGIKSVTSLIEPLMVFALGGIVGFIALAMLLPIFQLSSHSAG